MRSGRGIPTASSRVPTCPAGPFDGVVIANELLDNLPFRLAVFDGGWREAFVDVDCRRTVRRGPERPVRPRARRCCRRTAALGARAPIQTRRPAIGSQRRARAVCVAARCVAIDYRRRPTAVLGGATMAGVAAHLPRPRARRSLPRRARYPGHHHRGRRSTSCPSRTRSARRRSSCSCRGSTNSSRRAAAWNAQAARPGLEAMKMRSRVARGRGAPRPDGLGALHRRSSTAMATRRDDGLSDVGHATCSGGCPWPTN